MRRHPIFKKSGKTWWCTKPGDSYLVTGIDRNGKRFTSRSDDWYMISAVNVWRGTKWLVRDGRRFKINSIYN